VEILPELRAYEDMSFYIETNRNAECKINAVPGSGFASTGLPEFGVGVSQIESGARILHNVTVTALPPDLFTSMVQSMFNTTSFLSGIDTGGIQVPGSGDIVIPIEQGDAIEILLEAAESRRFYLFFRCIDIKGKEDVQDYFVLVSVTEPEVDPPVVEILSPPDEEFTNENVSFRYSVVDNNDDFLECSFYIGSEEANMTDWDSNITRLVTPGIHEINQTFANGTYNWNIGCKDTLNETFGVVNRTFTALEGVAIGASD